MTFEQLAIFVAVAEREHLTKAASHLHLTPSAVSSAIRNLEGFYKVKLFNRVGRGIELTAAGKLFLGEARATLARAEEARQVLAELGQLKRGRLAIGASQTIANYWLPRRLLAFREAHPDVELALTIGNTRTVTDAVIEGSLETGFIEGEIDEPAVAQTVVGTDRLVVAVDAGHPIAQADATLPIADLATRLRWIMREPGSGTRAGFETALRHAGFDDPLDIVLALPSNEAVLSALLGSPYGAVLSRSIAEPLRQRGRLAIIDAGLPERRFYQIRHKERPETPAARRLRASLD